MQEVPVLTSSTQQPGGVDQSESRPLSLTGTPLIITVCVTSDPVADIMGWFKMMVTQVSSVCMCLMCGLYLLAARGRHHCFGSAEA